jgi:hypothetical protein
MKKYMLVCVLILAAVITCMIIPVHAESMFQIPNLEAGAVYSVQYKICLPSMTSKFLQWKIVEGRVGYTTKDDKNIFISGLSVNLKNLPASVEYAWKDILDISTGVYVGWDSDNQKLDYGLSATLIKITF